MRLERLLAILLYLLKHKHATAQELANRFEVTVRTIYRDLDVLAQSGVPLTSQQGNGGGYGIIASYELNRLTFTTKEVEQLLDALAIQQKVFNLPNNMLLSDKIQHYQELLAANVKPNYTMGNITVHTTAVLELMQAKKQMLERAMQEQCLVTLTYVNAAGTETKREIYPVQIVYTSGTWYVYACCMKRSAIRYFKLSRMLEIQIGAVLESEMVAQILGCWQQFEIHHVVDELVDQAILQFPQTAVPYLYDYILPEQITRLNNEVVQVTFSQISRELLRYYVRLFIHEVEVISPLWLREEIKVMIQEMYHKYQT